MMAARWEWIFSITNILFFKKSYKSVFYEKIFLNFYLNINLIFWKTLYRLDKHAFCLNLALLVASINICHDCNLCLTGFLVPWVSNSEGLVQLFGCEHWAMTRLVCCDACLSLGSYPFLERAHAVIAYTVFWSNAVWATLNAWQPLTYMSLKNQGQCCLMPQLQNLSPLYLGWLCGRVFTGTWWLSAAWKLQCSLESVVHLERLWLIYLPGFLPGKNVGTGKDIGDLWIQHFISQLGKVRLSKGRRLSRGPTASAGEGSPPASLPRVS